MARSYSEIQSVARDYYNSDDADTYYHTVWGGEDLHLGIYAREDDSIFDASRRTVERMASLLEGLCREVSDLYLLGTEDLRDELDKLVKPWENRLKA